MVNNTSNTTEPLTIDAQLDLLVEEVETMKITVQDHLTGGFAEPSTSILVGQIISRSECRLNSARHHNGSYGSMMERTGKNLIRYSRPTSHFRAKHEHSVIPCHVASNRFNR
jgi:hypothetical protein